MSNVRSITAAALAAFFAVGLGVTDAVAQPADTDVPATAEQVAPGAEVKRLGDAVSGTNVLTGEEHGPEGVAGHGDPSKYFNFFNFSYRGKDVVGGTYGDGKNFNPETGAFVAGAEEPMSAPFVLMVVNFIILLALLAKFGGPSIRKLAAERHDQIKDALEEAATLRQQAADKLAEYQLRLADADSEIAKMVEGMRKDAEADKARILENAERQAAQMKRDAESRIAAEIELARATLTREVTAAATTATEKLLRDKLQAADQQKLVASFIADVQAQGRGAAKETV